jgi:hypothetical protein
MGDAVSLRGQGSMSLDKRVNLTFYAEVGRNRLREVPLLGTVLGEASQQLMQIHVDGTLDDPNTVGEALPVVNQALQQLQAELQSMSGAPAQRPQHSRLPNGPTQRR